MTNDSILSPTFYTSKKVHCVLLLGVKVDFISFIAVEKTSATMYQYHMVHLRIDGCLCLPNRWSLIRDLCYCRGHLRGMNSLIGVARDVKSLELGWGVGRTIPSRISYNLFQSTPFVWLDLPSHREHNFWRTFRFAWTRPKILRVMSEIRAPAEKHRYIEHFDCWFKSNLLKPDTKRKSSSAFMNVFRDGCAMLLRQIWSWKQSLLPSDDIILGEPILYKSKPCSRLWFQWLLKGQGGRKGCGRDPDLKSCAAFILGVSWAGLWHS